MKRPLCPPLIVSLGLLCAGCAGQLRSPQVPLPADYLYAPPEDRSPVAIDPEWWEAFGDTVLNGLVREAIANNRNLAVASSRLEEARLNLGVVRASYLPALGLGAQAEAEYTPQTRITQEYTVEPTVQWEISLFGTLANSTAAARAQILQTQWACRGVMLSVAAEVATSYFSLLQYRRSLDLARRTYALRQESTALIDSMYRYGMSSAVDWEQSRSLAAAAALDIPRYERAITQTQLALDVLLGRAPERADFTEYGWQLATDRLPEAVPVGLPSDLLERRPDVMQAYFALQAAAAQVGIARAARFPTILLTGEGGLVSTTVRGITSSKPWAWNVGLRVTQPLIGFGKLRRQEQMARARYDQSVLDYEQTVLEALADVEQALENIATYRSQAERYRSVIRSDENIRTMTLALYRSGLDTFLDVIDAERTLYSSQLNYIATVAQQYTAYIDLYKALGGGW